MEEPANDAGELHIEQIISGGLGLARRPDGCVVFVPRTAPGDSIEVEYTERHRKWRRARLTTLVQPGPARRKPPCEHYERCGGCQLQHIDYPAQLAAKADIVMDCLRRLGGQEISQLDVEPSPSEFSYRNRISLIARRSGDGIFAGYHALDNPDGIVDIDTCPLAEDSINAVWALLRAKLKTPSLVKMIQEARLTLRTTAGKQVGLVVESLGRRPSANDWIDGVEGLDAVWIVDSRGNVVDRTGAISLNETWGEYELPLSDTAFLQVNRQAADVLDTYVKELCGKANGRRIIDAYCGFGLRSLELAQAGADVIGIDVDHRSIDTAKTLAGQRDLAARFFAAPVERVLRGRLPADIVILNPPRRGVDRMTLRALERKPPDRIIYVSCNPATLARDIKGLSKRFRLSTCRSFDLFPQTAHVETVATLERVDSEKDTAQTA